MLKFSFSQSTPPARDFCVLSYQSPVWKEMDSERFCSRIEDDLLLCPICYDTFDRPRTLPCQHSFCHNCLQAYWTTTGRKNPFRCPTCQTVTTLPIFGIDYLPINDLLNKLKEMVSHLREISKVEITQSCQLCGGKSRKQTGTPINKLCLACVTDSPLLYLTRLVHNKKTETHRRIPRLSFQKLVNAYRLGYWVKNSHRVVDGGKTTEFAACSEDGMTCFEIRKCKHMSDGAAATNLPTEIGPREAYKHEAQCFYKSALFCTQCYEYVCSGCEDRHATHPLVPLYSDITRYSELFESDLSVLGFPQCGEFTSKCFIRNNAEEIEGIIYRLYAELGGNTSTSSTSAKANAPNTSTEANASRNGYGTDQLGLNSSTLLKQAIKRDFLTCAACKKVRPNLRVLTCQHSVCSRCLQSLLLAYLFRCPVCDILVKGLGEITDYLINRTLSELREIMATELRRESVESEEVKDKKEQNCTSCSSFSECCLDVCCDCIKRAKRARRGLPQLSNTLVVTDKVYKKIHSDMKVICEASLISLTRSGFMKCHSCHKLKDSSFCSTLCSKWTCSECASTQHKEHHTESEKLEFTNYVTSVSKLADKVHNIKRTPAVIRPFVNFGRFVKFDFIKRPKGERVHKPRNISKCEIKLIHERGIIRLQRCRRLRAWLNKCWELTLSDFLFAGLFLLLINLFLLVTGVISPNSLRALLEEPSD